MKLLKGKGIKHKIIIALVIVILFNFIMPTKAVRAESDVGGIGGVLFEPIKDLLIAVADGAVWVMHSVLYGQDMTLLKMSNTVTDIVDGAGTIGGIGVGAAIGFTIGGPVGALIGGAIGGYVTHQFAEHSSILPPTYYLPVYGISPREIFADNIPALDVNFFNPKETSEYQNSTIQMGGGELKGSSAKTLSGVISDWYYSLRNLAIVVLLCVLVYIGIRIVISSSGKDKAKYKERLVDWLIAMCLLFFMHYIMAFSVTLVGQITKAITPINKEIAFPLNDLSGYYVEMPVSQASGNNNDSNSSDNSSNTTDKNSELSNWEKTITKQNIASVLANRELSGAPADIKTHAELTSEKIYMDTTDCKTLEDYIKAQNKFIDDLMTSRIYTKSISYYQQEMERMSRKWYSDRMNDETYTPDLLKSYMTTEEVANRLDYVIKNEPVETLAVGNYNFEEDMNSVKNYIYNEMSNNCGYVNANKEKCYEAFFTEAEKNYVDIKIEEDGVSQVFGVDSSRKTTWVKADEFVSKYGISNGSGFSWGTNLMGLARLQLQMENTGNESTLMRQFGYTLIYLGFVIYTVLFLFRYLKRLLMLAFLTLIAPLMAMTYPLDKMKDGSAQGFNMWLKEYIFNLLIQPVHLILYTALIGGAMDLAEENMLYALVAFGFLLQAEKLLRKFFGFDKATTIDNGSALGGALAMQGINMLGKALGKGNKEDKKGGNGKVGGTARRALGRKEDNDKDINKLNLGTGGGSPLERNTDNNGDASGNDSNIPIGTPQERMLDAYDESFGTSDYDPTEREAMARELYTNDNNMGDGDLSQHFRDQGYSEDEIKDILGDAYTEPQIREATNTEPEVDPSLNTVDALEGGSPTESLVGEDTTPYIDTSSSNSTANRSRGNRVMDLLDHARSTKFGKGVAYVAPKAARLALKGTLTGAGAMAGIAAGLVSDNYANVPKWAGAGAVAGNLAGSGITGTVEGIGNRISAGYDGLYEATHTKDEIDARQNARADRQWARNEEIIKLYQEKLNISRAEAKEKMQTTAMKYRQYGIEDDKTIIKAMKADSKVFGADEASDRRIMLAAMATKVGNDQKKLQYVKETLGDKGVSKEHINEYVKTIKKMNKDDLI